MPPAAGPRSAAGQGPDPLRDGTGEAFRLPANLAGFDGAGGQALADPVREKMESFFGTSFGNVRVIVGPGP